MDMPLLIIGSWSLTLTPILLALGGCVLIVLLALYRAQMAANQRLALEAAGAAERQRELDEKLSELNALNASMTGRLQTMAEMLGTRQADLTRLMTERLDAVTQRMGQGLESSAKTTGDHLSKLNERLAVIDAAQNRMAAMTQEVVGLKDILANKQSRGAFGQGRMEAIVRDGLPSSAYEFQSTLSNRNRPDCVIRLPGDDRVMVVDAKFPLEAFTAFRDAADDVLRSQAGQRVRADLSKHIKDISERYFIPGETQDVAMLFVPAESVYGDLIEHFDDVMQKAHRARITIVSPSLLMMAVQVLQSIVRDARIREQAHHIQKEVQSLITDVRRLQERALKLDTHFRQAQEDVSMISTSAEKITKRGDRIEQLEFAEAPSNPISLIKK
ncbi:MAG: DNA recombination protein RmuC [Alphaproteobacteria bacterium]|nr:DNA recombination protein RmuC [Alphaproteobacteria bacterium]